MRGDGLHDGLHDGDKKMMCLMITMSLMVMMMSMTMMSLMMVVDLTEMSLMMAMSLGDECDNGWWRSSHLMNDDGGNSDGAGGSVDVDEHGED